MQEKLRELTSRSPRTLGLNRSRWTLELLREYLGEEAPETDAGTWRVPRRLGITHTRGQGYTLSPDDQFEAKRGFINGVRARVRIESPEDQSPEESTPEDQLAVSLALFLQCPVVHPSGTSERPRKFFLLGLAGIDAVPICALDFVLHDRRPNTLGLVGFWGRDHLGTLLWVGFQSVVFSLSYGSRRGLTQMRMGDRALFRRRPCPTQGRLRGLFNRVFFRARFFFFLLVLLFTFVRSVVPCARETYGNGPRQNQGLDGTNSGWAATKSGSGWDKFRVWMGQIQGRPRQNQGLDGTNSGCGYDKFRVGQFTPEDKDL